MKPEKDRLQQNAESYRQAERSGAIEAFGWCLEMLARDTGAQVHYDACRREVVRRYGQAALDNELKLRGLGA